MWNTRINDKNEDITSSARINFNEADRKIAFELFCLLDTAKTITGRTFHKSFVTPNVAIAPQTSKTNESKTA
jgi:hypothetical protein